VTVDGEAPSPATERTGTRKLVSILFADLSGSTSLQERLDVEATKRVMDRFHALLRAAIDAHAGTVVKFTGDGVMAVFEVPILREDDAVRAVRAGLAMQAAFAEMSAELGIGLRVGVNTGEVVVNDDGDERCPRSPAEPRSRTLTERPFGYLRLKAGNRCRSVPMRDRVSRLPRLAKRDVVK
jgi:class 3 adenylate cyclase